MTRTVVPVVLACTLVLGVGHAAEIRGTVVDADGRPLGLSSVTMLPSARDSGPKAAELDSGAYRFAGISEGTYDITISTGWVSLTVEAVHVGAAAIRVLPAIRIDGAPFCDARENRPNYYSPLDSSRDNGGIKGIVSSDVGPLPHVTVVLRTRGSSNARVSTTDSDGGFSFEALAPGSEYWLQVSASGYFNEEMTGLVVQAGLSTYYTVSLESCLPGRCQPQLKAIRVRPPCV